LTVFYALALLIVIPIVFLVGTYVISLFTEELFTQGIFFLAYGMFFIVVGGIIDLIAMMVLMGIKASLKASVKGARKNEGNSWRVSYYMIPALLICSYITATALVFSEEETLMFLIVTAGIIFTFFFLKWQVIAIPAKGISLLGNEKGLKRSRLSAVPFVILLFSFLPLVVSFRFEDAPIATIIAVYLEVLYALTIIINLYAMGGLVKDLNEEISSWEQVMEVQPGFERV